MTISGADQRPVSHLHPPHTMSTVSGGTSHGGATSRCLSFSHQSGAMPLGEVQGSQQTSWQPAADLLLTCCSLPTPVRKNQSTPWRHPSTMLNSRHDNPQQVLVNTLNP